MGHKDLRLGQIVYILVFYNISFSWLLPLDGFQFIFLLRDSASQGSIEWEEMGGAGQPLLPNGTFSKFIIACVAGGILVPGVLSFEGKSRRDFKLI